jgi:U3 small nucleolar RNA-associated protein 6
MGDCSFRELHERLLMGYVEEQWAKPNTGLISDQVKIPARWFDSIRHMDSAYLTTGRVWQKVFRTVDREGLGFDEKRKILGVVFEKWSRMDGLEARIEWGRWLLENGKGKEASGVMVGRGLELEQGWMGVLSHGRSRTQDNRP